MWSFPNIVATAVLLTCAVCISMDDKTSSRGLADLLDVGSNTSSSPNSSSPKQLRIIFAQPQQRKSRANTSFDANVVAANSSIIVTNPLAAISEDSSGNKNKIYKKYMQRAQFSTDSKLFKSCFALIIIC